MTQIETLTHRLRSRLEVLEERNEALIRLRVRLEFLADRLKAKLRPGHPEHISKRAAAEQIERELSDMEKLFEENT